MANMNALHFRPFCARNVTASETRIATSGDDGHQRSVRCGLEIVVTSLLFLLLLLLKLHSVLCVILLPSMAICFHHMEICMDGYLPTVCLRFSCVMRWRASPFKMPHQCGTVIIYFFKFSFLSTPGFYNTVLRESNRGQQWYVLA